MTVPYVIPTIGSSGYFQLREPFASKVALNVRYTCQGIRKISDYIANNENPKELVYDANGIDDVVYTEDLANDTEILSLQGETGQWLYVPVRYNISYPFTNGVPYRSMAMAVGLPAVVADQDYTNLVTSMKNLIKDTLGVDCVIDLQETSKVTLVPKEKHDLVQSQRNLLIGVPMTDRARYMSTLQELQSANQKIAALEAYIEENR